MASPVYCVIFYLFMHSTSGKLSSLFVIHQHHRIYVLSLLLSVILLLTPLLLSTNGEFARSQKYRGNFWELFIRWHYYLFTFKILFHLYVLSSGLVNYEDLPVFLPAGLLTHRHTGNEAICYSLMLSFWLTMTIFRSAHLLIDTPSTGTMSFWCFLSG